MDGENNGKPYFQMDNLGETPIFLRPPKIFVRQKEMATINTSLFFKLLVSDGYVASLFLRKCWRKNNRVREFLI